MITLQFESTCAGCDYADLELESFDFGEKKYWSVNCIHSNACEAMRRRVLQKKEQTDGGNSD